MIEATKDANINKSVQIHMSVEHSRKQGKSNVKRAFSLVMNGVLLSSMILGAITITGCQNSNNSNVKAAAAVTQQKNVDDESAYISNLKLAVKAINDTITANNWSATSFDNLCKSLINIENKLKTSDFKSNVALVEAIKEASKTVNGVDVNKISSINGLKGKYDNAVETLGRIKNRLNIKDEQYNQNVNLTSSNNETSKDSVSQSTQQAKAAPDKYKGYNLVSTRLKTVNSDTMIYVKYGNHTYGCTNQNDYDRVLEKVEASVKNIDNLVWTDQQQWLYNQTLNGVKYSSLEEGTRNYQLLKGYQRTWGLVIRNLNPDNSKKLIKGGLLWSYLASGKYTDPGDGTPSSASDILFRHLGDCDAQAQLECAIFDELGFNTRIIASSTHASGNVKVEKYWLDTTELGPVNPNPPSSSILVQPTY